MVLNKIKTFCSGVSQSVPIVICDKLGLSLNPRWVWIELTDRCNSMCKTCNIWRNKPTPKKDCLTPDELYTVLSNPLNSKVRYVLNSGGECTLIDLKSYLKAEHNALPKATLQISSNALLPDRLLDAVFCAIQIGVPRIDVGLSIDGIDAEHDKVRGVSGNFQKLEYTITELIAIRDDYPQVHVSMGSTLTDATAKSAKILYLYSEKVNIPFSWHWYNESQFYKNLGNCSTDSIKAVIDALPSKYLYWSLWQKYLRTRVMPKFKCFALKTFYALHCNGDVCPCLSRWGHTIGNVKFQSFSEVWKGKKAECKRASVNRCLGCLNSWGFGWSIASLYYPKLIHRLKHLLD